MGKQLGGIVEQLMTDEGSSSHNNPKTKLIFAFNGVGKTRLSREIKKYFRKKSTPDRAIGKVIYYNSDTDDLFHWDGVERRRFVIKNNSFMRFIIEEQGEDKNITTYFQELTGKKIDIIFPSFKRDEYGSECAITFDYATGDDHASKNIRISKGEESCFIWSVMYCLIKSAVTELKVVEAERRSTDKFNNLECIVIDDPVSSLDQNYLIELAVNLAELINSCQSLNIKFCITTHNMLFYNVICHELKNKDCSVLKLLDDGTFELQKIRHNPDTLMSYHLYLINIIRNAIKDNKIEKYHFTLIRNLYEKTASFLGYNNWADLLPKDKERYRQRITNVTTHGDISEEEYKEPSGSEKRDIKELFEHLISKYNFSLGEYPDGH